MKGIKPSRLASGINQYVVVATVESLHHPIKGQFGKLLIASDSFNSAGETGDRIPLAGTRGLFRRRSLQLGERSYFGPRPVALLLAGLLAFPTHARALMSDESGEFDGVYEFVEDQVRILEPEPKTTTRNGTDLAGLMIFRHGYYSETLMQRTRSTWVSRFPRYSTELGYSSAAGTYEVQGKILRLKEKLSLYPLYVGRSVLLEFQRTGDILILTERWEPHVENRSKGQRITTLRRIR